MSIMSKPPEVHEHEAEPEVSTTLRSVQEAEPRVSTTLLCSIRPNRYSSTQLTGQEEK